MDEINLHRTIYNYLCDVKLRGVDMRKVHGLRMDENGHRVSIRAKRLAGVGVNDRACLFISQSTFVLLDTDEYERL